MATEADLIQKFKDLNIPVGADFEELIHEAFAGANLVAEVENNLATKADDSKVVHSTDMRKPASDVAGIEEVNAKQDKIGYTPADDSKVLHSTVTELNSTDMNTVKTAGFYLLRSGTNEMPSGYDHTIYQVIPFYSSNGVQLAYGTNGVVLGMRSWNNYNHFTSWVQFADDSKVAHLSGANNFDTVPTVNNNPLLLASSLPSDLARTGQDANFTGKLQQNGQDVALANNTIARDPNTGKATDTTDFPYKGLTVDGYPIIPLVLVPDRAIAITKTAQYPNYAFMYGKELS